MSATILVIDDETNVRLMVKLALEKVGYVVETATDGADGLAKYGDGTGFDLILLDQRMPGMPGIEVQKAIYAINPNARLILITAFGTIDLAIEAIQAGASDFLRKPFTADTLRSTVKSALHKPVKRLTAVPLEVACKEFTRANINGFSFEFDREEVDEHSHDIRCVFDVSKPGGETKPITVHLPVYVTELVLAYADAEEMPGGMRFWQALCEEALANYLWQNADLPLSNSIRIEDLPVSMQRWLDSVLTVGTAD